MKRKPIVRRLPLVVLLLLPLPAQAQFAQQGPKLVDAGAIGDAEQVHSVSLSADGNTAIVGGPGDDRSARRGVYTRSGGVWTQQAALVGSGNEISSPPPLYICAGLCRCANGSTAIVGGIDGEDPTAWVFTRSGGARRQQPETEH